MRNQIHRQKQTITQKNIDHINQMLNANTNNVSQNQHKSVCFIQITENPENRNQDYHNYFRNTVFNKLSKRGSIGKKINNSPNHKISAQLSQQKGSKNSTKIISHLTTNLPQEERSAFIVQQICETRKRVNSMENGRKNNEKDEKHAKKISIFNQESIIKDIENLRNNQLSYLQLSKNRSRNLRSCSNTQNQSQEILITNQDQQYSIPTHSQRKISKEEIMMTLRNKIKNKQSRKHIYHTLKAKNELWNKIKLKTQPNFHHKQQTPSLPLRQRVYEAKRLHCEPKRRLKAQSLSLSKPIKSNNTLNSLKVESKPCILGLNCYSMSQPAQINFKQQYGSYQQSQIEWATKKSKSKRQAYQQIITSIKSSQRQHFFENKYGYKDKKASHINQFRLLTPWKQQYDDQN